MSPSDQGHHGVKSHVHPCVTMAWWHGIGEDDRIIWPRYLYKRNEGLYSDRGLTSNNVTSTTTSKTVHHVSSMKTKLIYVIQKIVKWIRMKSIQNHWWKSGILIKQQIYMKSFVKCIWVNHPFKINIYVTTIIFSLEAAMQSDEK